MGAVTDLFETARETPGVEYDASRFLAHLTSPEAASGNRVADTFAGRRRYVHFMGAVERELAVCFRQDEWDRGFTLDDFVDLVAQKSAKPKVALRLARKRLRQAKGHRVGDPIKFGLLAFVLLLIPASLVPTTAVRAILALLWLVVVGGVVAIDSEAVRHYRQLVAALEGRVGEAGAGGVGRPQ